MFDWISRALFGDDAEGAPPAAGVARVLLAGPTGAGKSTLLNAMLGEDVAETGAGEPVTRGLRWYGRKGLPVAFCDSEGIELDGGERQVAALAKAFADPAGRHRPHVAWLCVNDQEARYLDDGEGSEGAVLRQLTAAGIPAIVVVTKAERTDNPRFGTDAEGADQTPVVRVCARTMPTPDGGTAIAAHGLDRLHRATLDRLPADLRDPVAAAWPVPGRAPALNGA